MVDSVGMVNAVSGAPSYSGRMLRQLNAVGFAGATTARPLGARSGVRPGTPATTVTVTSTTWTCQPFSGLLDGQTAVEAGPYAFAFDAVATGAVTAASASIARVDIISVQVDDPSESDGSTVPAVTRKYLAGTVASTAPATPARSIVIARINVPISGGGSPTVTWVALPVVAAGGVPLFETVAQMNSTGDVNGELGVVLADYSVWQRRFGVGWVVQIEDTGWRTPTLAGAWANVGGSQSARYRRKNGLVQIEGLVAGGATGSTIFTLPAGFRPSAPSYYLVMANNGAAQLRVQSDGTVSHIAWVAGGTNALLSLSDISSFAGI